MSNSHATERDTPSRWQALVFYLKTRVFQIRRSVVDAKSRPSLHRAGLDLLDAPVIAEKRAPLWREMTATEFPLTAGKVENLRRAAQAFHQVEVPAGNIWSFWRQLGRTTKSKRFTVGRELREGCLVPAIGGGLCQLSGLLYQAALEAGLEIVERHGHSRIISGSSAELDLDATVFWNYVDLRFRSKFAWRTEVELTASEIVVRIRSPRETRASSPMPLIKPVSRAAPSGDCLTCGMLSCFRHPAAVAAHAPALGHSTFLLDNRWPEFDAWCAGHSRAGDQWFLPLDGGRWKKPNYQWSPPSGVSLRYATFVTLWRSIRQRRLSMQGAKRQREILTGDAALACRYAKMIDPKCRHIVVSQNLLPHLWKSGVLGGRSFDVLIERWPMDELQRRLDLAKTAHSQSTTLGDFRVDPDVLTAERDALAAAAKLVTPHRALAKFFGDRAWQIDWEMPKPICLQRSSTPNIFFPASRLGRKGAFELAEAIKDGIGAELKYLGCADEGVANPFVGIQCSQSHLADLAAADVLVLPAWIEHQPRIALLALASGIPVIATADCGLPEHPLLHVLVRPDAKALRSILKSVIQTSIPACTAT